MEELRRRELEKAVKMMENSDADRVMDDLTRSIVDKIFHDVAISIREAAERDDVEFLRACADIFGCDSV